MKDNDLVVIQEVVLGEGCNTVGLYEYGKLDKFVEDYMNKLKK